MDLEWHLNDVFVIKNNITLVIKYWITKSEIDSDPNN